MQSGYAQLIQNIFKGVQRTFKNVSFKTTNNLKKLLPNPKDKVENNDKSGIYKINCKDCDKCYIGQTKRSFKTRYKEHLSQLKFERPEKSAIAAYCISSGHSFDKIEILKEIVKPRYINAWGTYFINKNDKSKILNNDEGPIINSRLINLISKRNSSS